jgi:hypothetical protein
MTEYGRCPAFGYECEYVAKVEAQAAEIERLRGLLAEAVEYPASDYLDNGVLNRIYAALAGKAEQ